MTVLEAGILQKLRLMNPEFIDDLKGLEDDNLALPVVDAVVFRNTVGNEPEKGIALFPVDEVETQDLNPLIASDHELERAGGLPCVGRSIVRMTYMAGCKVWVTPINKWRVPKVVVLLGGVFVSIVGVGHKKVKPILEIRDADLIRDQHAVACGN